MTVHHAGLVAEIFGDCDTHGYSREDAWTEVRDYLEALPTDELQRACRDLLAAIAAPGGTFDEDEGGFHGWEILLLQKYFKTKGLKFKPPKKRA